MTNSPQENEHLDLLIPGDLESDAIARAHADEIRIHAYKDAFVSGIAALAAVLMPFYMLWLIAHGLKIEREWGLAALGGWSSLVTFLWVRNGGKRK